MPRLRFLLQASRPGLWFQTIWLYTLPTATAMPVRSVDFWLGLVFVLFPLNLLVYGWNDLVDRSTDALNPRKGNYLFGARGSEKDLRALPLAMAIANLPFFIAFTILRGWPMAAVLAGMVAVIALYNLPRHGLRARPPLELLNQLGYLLLLPFAQLLNHAPALPWPSLAYLVLFCTHAHLMGEIMDVGPDGAAGRRTTATVLGVLRTKGLASALVFAEAVIIVAVFRDWLLGAFLTFGGFWLLGDLLIVRDRAYSPREFRLFGLALNVAGFASMAWVWTNGTLTRIP